jgi:hypothetical protein
MNTDNILEEDTILLDNEPEEEQVETEPRYTHSLDMKTIVEAGVVKEITNWNEEIFNIVEEKEKNVYYNKKTSFKTPFRIIFKFNTPFVDNLEDINKFALAFQLELNDVFYNNDINVKVKLPWWAKFTRRTHKATFVFENVQMKENMVENMTKLMKIFNVTNSNKLKVESMKGR